MLMCFGLIDRCRREKDRRAQKRSALRRKNRKNNGATAIPDSEKCTSASCPEMAQCAALIAPYELSAVGIASVARMSGAICAIVVPKRMRADRTPRMLAANTLS
jgi:hypothetical protein